MTARRRLPGRSLDLVSNGEARGMVVTPTLAQAIEGGQNSAYGFAAIFFHAPTPASRRVRRPRGRRTAPDAAACSDSRHPAARPGPPAAEHHRLQAEVDARDDGAPAPARQIPG